MKTIIFNKKNLIILLLLWCGCKPTDEKSISEGTIDFDVEVIDKSSSLSDMLPSKMTVKFKNNKSSVEMSAGMGLFSSSFISDPSLETFTVCLKILNKKLFTTQGKNEIDTENDKYPIEITKTKDTKLIAGYNCTKAHVKPLDPEKPEFDIFYTNEIQLKNPNFATPFHSIDGVLMEYQMKKFGFELRFKAKSVINNDIEDSIFEVPSDYKRITMEEIDELFLGFQ